MRTIAVVVGLVSILELAGSGSAQAAKAGLEIYTEEGAPLTAQQEWLSALAGAGVENLQIRPQRATDKPAIETRGTPANPSYMVTGALTRSGELMLPGARFRLNEAGRLARWLEDVARMGPSLTEEKTAFGLTARQYAQIQKELAEPVGAPTKDRSRREVIEIISRRLTSPLRIDAGQLQSLGADPITVELGGLSCGTVLAYVLRAPGLAMVPAPAPGGAVEYRVVASQPGLKIWPVGWETEKTLQQVLPDMFEFLKIDVQGVPVTEVLDAVQKRLNAPVLLDQNALARYGIEPEKVTVSLPPGRTSYNLLLRKVLSQAKLKYEIRVDEAGKPLVWVTTLKPL
jgi:hypothetical protein